MKLKKMKKKKSTRIACQQTTKPKNNEKEEEQRPNIVCQRLLYRCDYCSFPHICRMHIIRTRTIELECMGTCFFVCSSQQKRDLYPIEKELLCMTRIRNNVNIIVSFENVLHSIRLKTAIDNTSQIVKNRSVNKRQRRESANTLNSIHAESQLIRSNKSTARYLTCLLYSMQFSALPHLSLYSCRSIDKFSDFYG